MKTICAFLMASLAMTGCVSGTVTEPSICDTATLGTIPASPIKGLFLTDLPFSPPPFNFSSTVSKIQDVASGLSVDISQLTINNDGDLDWVSNITVNISSETMPTVPFATYTNTNSTLDAGPGAGRPHEITLDVQMDSATLLQYLSSPVTLTFTISGEAPTEAVTITNTMCISASGSFTKSL